jgi:hypothetical protein
MEAPMTDDKDKDKEKSAGKQYRGQSFPPVRTADDVQEAQDAQEPYNKPDAVDLHVYFASQGIRDPVQQAAMRAYTKVSRATPEDWAKIFDRF